MRVGLRFKHAALIGAVALGLALGGSPAHAGLKGDCNGDGALNVNDAIAVLRMALDPQEYDAKSVSDADLSPTKAGWNHGDGKINVADAVAVLRLIVGLDDQEKYGAPDGPPETEPGIRFAISTPRGTYELNDAVPFVVTLRNETDKEASWDFPSGCQIGIDVANAEGKVVWSMPEVCTLATTKVTLKPGGEKEWKFTWLESPNEDKPPTRSYGVHTATARLLPNSNPTEYRSSVTFQFKEITDPVPIPGGPATFDLTPGRADHYVDARFGREETIHFIREEERDGKKYTLLSLSPDGPRDVLLRLDQGSNHLIQLVDGKETVRLKLNAEVGDKWDFGDDEFPAHATLVSRSASLKTPGGVYHDLLEFNFEVGPDAGWTEWVHPKGFWVGYTQNTIAGPVEFRITNRDLPGTPGYTAKINPPSAQLRAGQQVRFTLEVFDETGQPVPDPGVVKWGADDEIGKIEETGLFTATLSAPLDYAKGVVTAEVTVKGQSLRAFAEVGVGTMVPPPPPIISIEPQYVRLKPGATQEFHVVTVIDSVPGKVEWSSDPTVGTIEKTGLFSALFKAVPAATHGVAGVVKVEVLYGDQVHTAYAKVEVGAEDPGPDPTPNERLGYLQYGSLKAGPSPTMGPTPTIQVEIHGDMPDPSWSYDHTEIKREGDTITLYPFIKRVHDGAAPAVLKPFTAMVQVPGLISGKTYTIIAVGHDTKLTTEYKVE